MRRNRRLAAVLAVSAGLIGISTLTGAASASAATTTESHRPAASAPARAPGQGPTHAPGDDRKPATDDARHSDRTRDDARHSDRIIEKVKEAVLDKYPKVTIDSVTARDHDGWTVTVTTKRGATGTVHVDRDLSVGDLQLQRGHRSHG